MKIPSPSNKIKSATQRFSVGAIGTAAVTRVASGQVQLHVLAMTLALVTSAFGCAPVALTAPFPARADTVEPGSLVGPFDGRVVDASTGHPVPQALVFASWGLQTGRGLEAPAGAQVTVVETDSDGRYQIPAFHGHTSPRTRLERFTLIIYKRGFVAYRSDRRFEHFQPRRDFSQRLNQVRLERFGAEQSHAQHVRFIGGAGPLRAALEPEIVQASFELAGESAGGAPAEAEAPGMLLDVSGLLSPDELKAATGYDGVFSLERLADLPRTATYDSRHFRAQGHPESFDAAIRVWRLPSEEAAAKRFDAVKATTPNAVEVTGIGAAAVGGQDGPIRAIVALADDRHLVIELTCGVDQCRDAAQLEALMRRLLSRADRLKTTTGAVPEAAPPKEPEPKPAEPAPEPTQSQSPSKPEEENPFQLQPPTLHR
jgi:hypothetical protein